MTTTTKDLAKYVADYALKNYESGWDYIVECWELNEIEEALIENNATSEKAALAVFEPLVEIFEERRADGTSYMEGGY